METANISHRAIGADEKAFIGDSAEKFAQKTHGITLKNVRHALQLIYRKTDGIRCSAAACVRKARLKIT